MDEISIRAARPTELTAVEVLLRSNGLPLDGLSDMSEHLVVAVDNGNVIGCAGLEVYGDGVLLRSLAVDPAYRGRGLGDALCKSVLDGSVRQGAPAVYLLTETAETFFERRGFVRITREDVPASVLESVEFTGACPVTAAVMMQKL